VETQAIALLNRTRDLRVLVHLAVAQQHTVLDGAPLARIEVGVRDGEFAYACT
jgi:hypothetical protein